MTGTATIDDLIYLLYFWIFTLISAVFAEWTRLSPLLFYLCFGCFLGNVEWVKPTPFMTSFGEFSIAVVFFALGFEEQVSHFMEGIRKAWGIASIGAAVPFICGFGFTILVWPDIDVKAALMCGLAVTATAVSLTMIALKAEGLATSKPAIGIMTSAVLDDIASLALVAIMVPIATGEAEVSIGGIAWILAKAVIFFATIIVSHKVILPHDVTEGWVARVPIMRTYGIRDLLKFGKGEQATLMSLTLGLGYGMVAVALGFHPAIGTYMGGLIFEEHYFELDDDEGNTYHSTRYHIENAAFSWLGPVFFLNLGASIIIDLDILQKVIGYSVILYLTLGVGQFVSASVAARYVPGGFTWAESAMIGFGMLGRAELFFVVLNLCYNDKGLFDKEVFYTFTFAAMFLNMTVPIAITVYKPFYKKYNKKPDKTGITTPSLDLSDVPNGSPAWMEDERPSAKSQAESEDIEEALSGTFENTVVGDWVTAKARKRESTLSHRIFQVEEERASSKEIAKRRLGSKSSSKSRTSSEESSNSRRCGSSSKESSKSSKLKIVDEETVNDDGNIPDSQLDYSADSSARDEPTDENALGTYLNMPVAGA